MVTMAEGKWHEKKVLEMTSKILIELLVLVDSEDPVYIVLDPADQCTCSRNRLLEKLASVAREARCSEDRGCGGFGALED